jgi:hypothetical protein
MKAKLFFTTLFLSSSILLSAQLKVRKDGSVQILQTSTYPVLWLGSYSSEGSDNGEWEIDTNGGTGAEMGSLNIGKPWPSPNFGNYKFFIARNGNVGIGKIPSTSIKLDVDGSIATYGQLVVSSDERLKSDILPLSEQSANLYKLNAKSYKKSLPENKILTDERNHTDKNSGTVNSLQSSKKVVNQNTEFGFLAQELKVVFPNLVKQDSAGYYLVDYIGLIPVIVETLKEQKDQIDAQKTQIDSLLTLVGKSSLTPIKLSSSLVSDIAETDILTYPVLDQNIPNPFNISTSIGFYLPSTVAIGNIYVYDMNGNQLKNFSISERGKGTVTIHGSEFSAGMYLYALVTDGKVIDTKRMILTN